jgi:acylphosphatase
MKEWKSRAHIVVSGLVQGVGYRYFVYRKAKEYNLKGYVRNLYSDDVEVMLEGDKGVILDFIKELKTGPISAHVTGVKVDWEEGQSEYEDFEIKF